MANLDEFETKRAPWVALAADLNNLGIPHGEFPVPRICVVGDQSSGKSSVLESISGMPFPRGVGTVTRCVTELRMERQDTWRATAKIEWRGAERPQPPGAGAFAREDFAHTVDALTTAMLGARGANVLFESENHIRIDIAGPDVPTLTLLDLPGIVRNPPPGQPETIMAQVNGLIDRYLEQEQTIILAVFPVADPAIVEILRRARKADPLGARMIGVMTKPDLVDIGAEKQLLASIDAQNLALGFYMVKNRSQLQIDEHLTLVDARARELDYLRGHSTWRDLGDEKLGVAALTTALSKLIVGRMQEWAPAMREQLAVTLRDVQTQLDDLGAQPPETDVEMREAAGDYMRQIHDLLRDAGSGVYNGNALFADDRELLMLSRIRDFPENTFAEAVIRPNQPHGLTELAALMSTLRGNELPGFLSFSVFETLVNRDIEHRWEAPLAALLEGVRHIAIDVCEKVIKRTTGAYAGLVNKITTIARDVIASVTTWRARTSSRSSSATSSARACVMSPSSPGLTSRA